MALKVQRAKSKAKGLMLAMKLHGIEFHQSSKKLTPLLDIVQRDKTCLFCLRTRDDLDEYGELIHHKASGIWVHYFCLLLASNLKQTCADSHCDIQETPTTVYGFRVKDILSEFKRGSKLKCSVCHRPGATIGCCVSKCRSKFHFSCGLQRNFLFQYFGSFPAYCKSHRPVQSLSIPKNESRTCRICLEEILLSDTLNSLCAPCCKDSFFHRDCIKKQALSCGQYFFRCPTCNNKEDYTNEMLRMGIFVPDRDASWETPGAFSELLERAHLCDIPHCKCKHGRKYNKTGTIWSISLCVLCGSSGAHVACAMLQSPGSPFVCEICYNVFGQIGIRKTLRDMGIQNFNAFITAPQNSQDPVTVMEMSSCQDDDKENRCVTRSRKRKREMETVVKELHGSQSPCQRCTITAKVTMQNTSPS